MQMKYYLLNYICKCIYIINKYSKEESHMFYAFVNSVKHSIVAVIQVFSFVYGSANLNRQT